ncbi:MAG: hypothetical protein CSA44_01100 [Gammaproteobacteria bacterium]|nr:MAG: hypothetical protein CSA44_01100 [Gammaproteobacteria bacterium]
MKPLHKLPNESNSSLSSTYLKSCWGAQRAETGVYLTTHEWSGKHTVNEPAQLLAKLLAVVFRAPRNEVFPANRCIVGNLFRAGVCAKVSISLKT